MNPANSNQSEMFLEDFYVGQRFTSGFHRITAEEIKAFAAQFDPQPFHLDEAAARVSVFRGLAASGWHTAAITMRLLVDGGLPIGGGLVGLSGEFAWPNATRPDDLLRVESEVLEIKPSRTKPNQAIVDVLSTTTNQLQLVVYRFTAKLLVFRRPAISGNGQG